MLRFLIVRGTVHLRVFRSRESRQKQRREDRDDGNRDEKLDEGEA